jgi:hypothetical protein
MPNIVTMTVSGVQTAVYNLDNSTLTAASNIIKVANAGITTTQIAASAGILGSQLSASAGILSTQLAATNNITGSQMASQTITQGKLAVRPVGSPNGAAGAVVVSRSNTYALTAPGTTIGFDPTATQSGLTISIASPAVIGIGSTSALYVNQPIVFSGGTIGTVVGITAGTTYYVSNIINSTTFNVSATINGSSINTTGTAATGVTAVYNTFGVVLACTGRPVMLSLTPDGTTNPAYLAAGDGTHAGALLMFLLRNGTIISKHQIGPSPDLYLAVPPGSVNFIDTGAPAGTNAYTAQVAVTATSGYASITNVCLTAYEL